MKKKIIIGRIRKGTSNRSRYNRKRMVMQNVIRDTTMNPAETEERAGMQDDHGLLLLSSSESAPATRTCTCVCICGFRSEKEFVSVEVECKIPAVVSVEVQTDEVKSVKLPILQSHGNTQKQQNPSCLLTERPRLQVNRPLVFDEIDDRLILENDKRLNTSFDSLLCSPLNDNGEDLDMDCNGTVMDSAATAALNNACLSTTSVVEKSSSIPSSRAIGIQCSRACISLYDFQKMTPERFKFFCGVNQKYFHVLYQYIGGDEVCSKLKYAYKDGTPRKPVKSTLTPLDRLFMTLMRLRRGTPIVDLAHMFAISTGWASSIIYTWIRFLSLQLQSLQNNIFPSAEVQNSSQIPVFKGFKNLRGIIDCTEIKIQHPNDFRFQSNSYSNYKSTNTLKYLVVVSVYGGISFVSKGFEGSMSDKQVLLQSGFLQRLTKGDKVMCDRGFDVEAQLNEIGVDLIIPPFKGKHREFFSARECVSSRSISSARIFVEIAIGKIKHYRILRGQIPNLLLPVLDDIVYIASILSQFNSPFIE